MTNLPIATAFAALVVVAATTPLVRALARRVGAVARPQSDRWHKRPTAMLGGVAIFLGVVVVSTLVVPATKDHLVVILASSGLFLLGLVDDFLHLKPYQKLIGQLLAASAVIYFGLVLPWTSWPVVNILITFLWLVGVTNAVNMLDNMDGLATGVAAIAAASLAITFVLNGQQVEALMLSAFCGALLGFLIYNHSPASIFMGDCGSLFVGFFLASSALLASQAGGGRSRSIVAVLAPPVLVLCIPIFDTTFVTLMRKLAGRPASQGGRDHTSHRLVALGLSEKQAVWMLFAFAGAAGSLALLVRQLQTDVSIASIGLFVALLTVAGVHLAGVRVYGKEEIAAEPRKPIVSFLVDLTYKRRIFEVALDVVFIVLAQYGAYLMLFGPARADSSDWGLFLQSIPIIIFVKLVTLLLAGAYRGLWRYSSLADLVMLGRAVVLSSVASVLVLLLAFRFDGYSRTVFVIDGLLLLMLVPGSRFAFRMLRRMLPVPHAGTGTRVLVFGAGDGGELTCRELMNNSDLQYLPVAFLDDDPTKVGKVMHGLPVYSPQETIAVICRRTRAAEVFLSTRKLAMLRMRALVAECEAAGIPVKRLRVEIDRLADEEIGWVLPVTTREEPDTEIVTHRESLT